MKRERQLLKRGGCLVLIVAAVLFIDTGSALALIRTNPTIGQGGPVDDRWYTEYTVKADELNDPLAAFYVDRSDVFKGAEYELIAVPDQFDLVGKFADPFFTHGGDQRAYQVAVWDVFGIKEGTAGSSGADARSTGPTDSSENDGVIQGNIALAHGSLGGAIPGGVSLEDLMGASALTPEHVTMLLLLGTGLISLAGVSRKRD